MSKGNSKGNSKRNSKGNSKSNSKSMRSLIRLSVKCALKQVLNIKSENERWGNGKKLTFKQRLIEEADLERAKLTLIKTRLKQLYSTPKGYDNRIGSLPKRYTTLICPNRKFESLSSFLKRI